MLRTLDSTDSYLDITLPQGSKLQDVILYKPIKLDFTNNIALANLTIQNSS